MFKNPRLWMQLIARSSDIAPAAFQHLFQSQVYPNENAWKRFLRILLLTLAVGFFSAGLFFFIAYNWQAFHPFGKLSIIAFALLLTILFYISTNWSDWVKQGLLVLSMAGVGGLMMVFGQIYQTGANAYDLFLAWTVFVTIWVVLQQSSIIWACWFLLITITIHLFFEQVYMLRFFLVIVLLAGLYLGVWKLLQFLKARGKWMSENWLSRFLFLAFIGYASAAAMIGIYTSDPLEGYLFLMVLAGIYSWLLWESWKLKDLFQIAFVLLSTIVLFDCLLFKWINGRDQFLFGMASIFNTGAITLLIILLINLSKKWRHENI